MTTEYACRVQEDGDRLSKLGNDERYVRQLFDDGKWETIFASDITTLQDATEQLQKYITYFECRVVKVSVYPVQIETAQVFNGNKVITKRLTFVPCEVIRYYPVKK
jgi:hypothetical protein